MHGHQFSDGQAHHALVAVLRLMKEHRFFLAGDGLDPQIFRQALELDEKIRDAYKTSEKIAEQMILETERRLGVTPATLPRDRYLVQCHRYTGGLEICQVYPLTAFTELAAPSLEELESREVARQMGTKTADEYSPKALREFQSYAKASALAIWDNLAALKKQADENSCAVLLRTRFAASDGDAAGDFLHGKLSTLQLFPMALGYLFYEYSKRTRIVPNDYVVFSTSRHSHVRVSHMNGEDPTLTLNKTGGYSVLVYVLLAL